jgi:hypothetical protein
MAKVTIELDQNTVAYLKLLDPSGPEAALSHLAHSAADGIRRPGAWERGWLGQAFPEDEFLERVREKIEAGEMVTNEWGQLDWK